MLRDSKKRFLPKIVCAIILLTIPSWAHATTFSFSTINPDGATFSGTFSITPNPPDPLNFLLQNPGSPSITNWSFTATGLSDPNYNFYFDPTTQGLLNIQGVGVSNGTLFAADFHNIFSIGFFYRLAGGELRVIGTPPNGTPARSFFGFTPPVVSQVPEPTSIFLLATGLLGLAGYRWHHRQHERAQLGNPPSAQRH